jgi:hypothetical protein
MSWPTGSGSRTPGTRGAAQAPRRWPRMHRQESLHAGGTDRVAGCTRHLPDHLNVGAPGDPAGQGTRPDARLRGAGGRKRAGSSSVPQPRGGRGRIGGRALVRVLMDQSGSPELTKSVGKLQVKFRRIALAYLGGRIIVERSVVDHERGGTQRVSLAKQLQSVLRSCQGCRGAHLTNRRLLSEQVRLVLGRAFLLRSHHYDGTGGMAHDGVRDSSQQGSPYPAQAPTPHHYKAGPQILS